MTKRGRKPDQARREMVVRMRDDSGMTFTAIGKALHPQVSRQVARQTYLRGKAVDIHKRRK